MVHKFSIPLAIFLCLAAICSCSKNESESTSLSLNQPPSDSEGDGIILYSWGEYFEDALLERFTAETGIKVSYETYESGDEMMELIKSNPGKYDVVVMDDLRLERMRRTRVIREFDKGLLTNLTNIDESHVSYGKDGALHSIPYCWGTTLVAYNKNHVNEPEPSWALLFDPSLRGKVSVIDDRIECTTNLLNFLGYPHDSEEATHLQKVSEKLMELATNQEVTVGSDVEAHKQLLDDSVWATMIYSVDLAQALDADEEGKIGYFFPKEGTTKWVDNFTIPRDSKRWRAAHRFVNFMMDPKVAAECAVYACAASANKNARPYIKKLDPELLDSVAYVEGDPQSMWANVEGSPNRQRIIHEGWQAFEKALRSRMVATSSSEDEES